MNKIKTFFCNADPIGLTLLTLAIFWFILIGVTQGWFASFDVWIPILRYIIAVAISVGIIVGMVIGTFKTITYLQGKCKQ